MNNTTTVAANETLSPSPASPLSSLPDPRNLLATVESSVSDKLLDWGQDPFHAMFLFVLVLLVAFAFNYLTSGATAKMQGGNKYLLFIIIILGILWFLEVI